VEVHFHSPYALASATLKVVGPAGALTLDPAPVLEPTTEPPPNDAPFTYKLVWQGPWTTTVNGQPGPLPRGNYTATVTGVRTDGQGSVWSAPYDKISLVEVTQTELVAIPGEATLDDNPAVGTLPGQTPPQSRPGGGKRIFAESTSAGGPILNRVQVVATIDPPIPADAQFPPAQTTVRVHFASYDVDDPAPYAPDKDNDTGDVADNRGTPANGSASPDYFDIQPGQTEASTNFTVSGQPGDNYRVAASTSQDWLLGLKAVQPSTTGEMTVPTEAPGPVSEMLTVWRTLNVELESMAAPPPPTTLPGSPAYLERNFIRGRVLRVRRNEAGVPVYMDLEPEVTPPPPPPQPPPPVLTVRDRSLGFEEGANGRFEHGSIRVGIEATGILLTNLDGNGVKLPEDYDYVRKVGPTPPTTIALQARLVTAQGTSPIRPWVLEWDASTRQFLLNMNVSTIYVGGQFSLGGVNWTIASVSGATVTVQQEQPDKPLPFFLADDDAASYPFLPNQSLLQASDDPLQNPLAQAYVRPKYFPTGPKVPPFNRNINCLGPGPPPTPCDVTEFVQQLAAGRDIPPSTPGFWASYVQGASQGDEAYGDLDPQSEWPVSDIGSTLGQGDAYGSFAYSDSTRDWLVQEQEPDQLDHCSSRVLVHELGHQFGLDHGSHGIMPYASCLSNENYFEASDIETIREKKGLIP
jgi:hypothetical protein